MSRSRNWIFKLDEEIQYHLITKKVKDGKVKNITFLQLAIDTDVTKGLVVMKNRVRKSAVRKMFSVIDVELVTTPKEVMNSMGTIIFTYGKLLNKHEKRLTSKASSYSHTVQHLAEKILIPEDEPKFELVYK